MKETAFAASIKKKLKEQGHRAIKWHGGMHGEAGIPDLYVMAAPHWRGWLELKMDRNTVTDIQRRVLLDLRERGEPCYVLRRRPDGMLLLEEPEEGRIVRSWRGVSLLIPNLCEV